MTKTLIIAEKPSVALDISRALGGFTREGDYYESDEYVLAASIGHLLGLVAPNDPVRGKWTFTNLPVIPPQFELKPNDKRSAERLKLLVKLIKRKDVNHINNACDAGREGELIFRYIMQYAGEDKPISRLWLRSMTRTAIREAFDQLRSDEELKPLEQAARARAEADWLIGINGTRAMTAFNSKDGGFFKTTDRKSVGEGTGVDLATGVHTCPLPILINPISRLWLRTMPRTEIRAALDQHGADEELKPLEQAARARAEADWLIGINGTRAMTAFNSKDGGFFKTTVGRVQTPTLTIVHTREEQIRRLKPGDYWEIHATFAAQAGNYTGRWFDPEFKKDEQDPALREQRLWDAQRAQAIVDACMHEPGIVSETSRPSRQQSPALFDLTSLQREANSRFGFSANTTLSIAQALYERHKVLTYPRTDSRYLPEDYLPTVRSTFETMATSGAPTQQSVAPFAQTVLDKNWVKPNKRIFNNERVSDHFAIIPTQQAPKNLSDAEFKVYELVARRFLAVFFPAAEYRLTTRITRVKDEHFKTEGRVLVSPGWLAIYGREAQGGEDSLVPVQENETVQTEDIELHALQTKPPARFTEATLLSALEGAGKLVVEDALREAVSGRGLRNPATPAPRIEGVLQDGYLRREGRELIPTAKARQLMTLLNGLGVSELTSPGLTGDWEHRLKQIEMGETGAETFLDKIEEMTKVIVAREIGRASGRGRV